MFDQSHGKRCYDSACNNCCIQSQNEYRKCGVTLVRWSIFYTRSKQLKFYVEKIRKSNKITFSPYLAHQKVIEWLV